jgi:pyruvate dehydrogenase E1 component beta subunit
VKKTKRLVTVEEGWPQCGVTAEIIAIIMESDAFDYLDAPVERITGADVPMPYSIPLEKLALPQQEDVMNAIRRVVAKKM